MASFWNTMQLHTFPVGNVVRGQLNKTKTIPHVTKKMHSHFLYGLSIIVLRDVIKIVYLYIERKNDQIMILKLFR